MKLTYLPCESREQFEKVFTHEVSKPDANDYVEGLLFSLDRGVVMTGQMVPSAEPNSVSTHKG